MRNPRKEIMLQNTMSGLHAHFLINGRPNSEIVRLFGTHILPTPFIGSDTTMDRAAAEIAKLNPGYVISII